MKKFISLILSIVMILSVTAVFASGYPETTTKSYPQKFWDVSKDHWAFEYIAELTNRGVISGYNDGSFKPNRTVTRAEWAKIMVGAAGIICSDESIYFSDTANHWALKYINAAKNYLTAYADNTYRPDQAVVREDVTMAMVRLKGYNLDEVDYSYLSKFTDQDTISNNVKAYVAVAIQNNLINGFEDNTFRGQDTLTRAEAATLLWRAFQYGSNNKVVDTPNTPVTTPNNNNNTVITQPTEKPDTTPNTSNEQKETQEPTPTPEPEIEIKPYKVDTIVKANVKNSYHYTSDNKNNIYYVDGNKIYKANVNSKESEEILDVADLTIDNDEMTLDDFSIESICYDTFQNRLLVVGNYKTVNSVQNINSNYLYEVRGNNAKVITDNFEDKIVFVSENGDYINVYGNILDASNYDVINRIGGNSCYTFYENSDGIYCVEYWGPRNCRVDKYDYVKSSILWDCPIAVDGSAITKDKIIIASNHTVYNYNYNGKELSKITPDDYEVKDKRTVNFVNSENKLIATSDNNIIFYDTTSKAFRMISENN